MPPSDPAASRRVALFGGSFNPPHHGHVLVATYALATGRFDEVRLLPVFGHAFGKGLAPFEQRVAMARAAVAHLGPRVGVETIEETLAAPSYTIDTLRALAAREPEAAFTWIMGADTYAERERWRAWDEISRRVDLLVFGREGTPDPAGVMVPTRFPNVSATEVRARVAAGAAIDTMVAPAVARIISAHGLYR